MGNEKAAAPSAAPVFTIRWEHKAPSPFICAKAGAVIKVIEYHKTIKLKVGADEVECKNIAKVSLVGAKDPSKTEGYANAMFINVPEQENYAPAERDLMLANKYPAEVVSPKWNFGAMSHLQVASEMASDVSICWGSYVVCSPSVILPAKEDKNQWPPLMLVVKTVTGTPEQWAHEWLMDEEHNAKYKDYPTRKTLRDRLPAPHSDPAPSIIYLMVNRTETGEYFLGDEKDVYPNLLLLVMAYKTKKYNLKFDGQVPLLRPAHIVDREPYEAPPVPPIYPHSKPKLVIPGPKSLVRCEKTEPLDAFTPRLSSERMANGAQETSGSGCLYRGVFLVPYQNRRIRAKVAVRKIDERRYNEAAFQADLNLLMMDRRAKNETLSESQKKELDIRGHEYLFHIMAFNSGNEKDNWIAFSYEHGFPVDQFLRLREFEADYMPDRPKLDIVYQVVAAMRFLELNGLCHRHLRASNVIVTCEQKYHFVCKLCDYMLPYHFFNKVGAPSINQADFDWPWFAPESLQDKVFDIQSDVWAFACLCFEINTDGFTPYAFEKKKIENKEQLKELFDSNQTMCLVNPKRPVTCNVLTDIMKRCLKKDPKERPTFKQLHDLMFQMLYNFSVEPVEPLREFFKDDPNSKYTKEKPFEKECREADAARKFD